jgi:hypothetical protein
MNDPEFPVGFDLDQCASEKIPRHCKAGRTWRSYRDRLGIITRSLYNLMPFGSKNNSVGEPPMQEPLERPKPLSQRTSNELVRLILKLRWAGMEKEAETVAEELAGRRAGDVASVVAEPRETD